MNEMVMTVYARCFSMFEINHVVNLGDGLAGW